MEGMTVLALAYIGMIGGIAIWTWTVFSRSNSIMNRISALEQSLGVESKEADSIAKQDD